MNFQFINEILRTSTHFLAIRKSCDPIRKFLNPLLGVLVMAMAIVPGAWAEEHVITIYFGGTGLTENGYWTGNDDRKGRGNTRWDTPSLIASLHHNHKTTSLQHKIYVAGVGAKESSPGVPANHCSGNPKTNLLSNAFKQQKKPHEEKLVGDKNFCRNWIFTVIEATVSQIPIYTTVRSKQNLLVPSGCPAG